jgi:hypothetical protein
MRIRCIPGYLNITMGARAHRDSLTPNISMKNSNDLLIRNENICIM